MIKVLFLFGEICSGKSTFKPDGSFIRIEVSQIVREVAKATTREQLQDTAHLGSLIADQLIQQIEMCNNRTFEQDNTIQYLVVDGIRQYSILQKLEQYIDKQLPNFSIEYKWLEVNKQERKRRFEARKDTKDVLSFEEAEKRDNQLGLSELYRILKKQNKIQTYGATKKG